MGRIVIVAYHPKNGKEQALAECLRDHVRILQEQTLATAREAILMRSANGTMIEVFEWISAEAIQQAHLNAAVQDLWARFVECCDYVPLSSVQEASNLFAEFAAMAE